jgi:hypothetical protein
MTLPEDDPWISRSGKIRLVEVDREANPEINSPRDHLLELVACTPVVPLRGALDEMQVLYPALIRTILEQKKIEIVRLRAEIDALRAVIPLLESRPDDDRRIPPSSTDT